MHVNPFKDYHPAVALTFMVSAIVLSMACMQPVYVALAFIGSFVCLCVTRGVRKAFKALLWAIPLFLIIAIVNPILSSSGSSELFRIGTRAVYLESAIFGACAGGMLASVLMWFSAYSDCMDSESSMALFGNIAPTVSSLVSQVLRLVPQFVSRGRDIRDVQLASSAAAAQTKKQKMAGYLRVVNVLAGWGMEDGLIRGEAMRARGYGCGVKRTLYKRFKFGSEDAFAVCAIMALAVSSAIIAFAACSEFAFYPTVGTFVHPLSYTTYILLLAVPVVLAIKEYMEWH